LQTSSDFSFFRFVWALIKQRRWHYAGGILSVIILDAVDMLPALIIKHITDQAQVAADEVNLLTSGAGLIACYTVVAILRLAWRHLLMVPSRQQEAELRQHAYERLLQADYNQAASLKTGDVVSTLSQELSNLRMFMGPGILVLFDSLAYLIFIPATLFYILGSAAIWVLLPFLGLAVAVFIVQSPLEKGHGAVASQLGDLSQYVYEEAQGARFFRAEGLIELRRRRYQLLLQVLFGKYLQIAKWELLLDGTLQLVIQTSYFIVLVLAWQGQGEMAQGLGALAVSLQLMDKLLWPLLSTSFLMNLFQQARSGARRYHEVARLPKKQLGPTALTSPLRAIRLEKLSATSPSGEPLLHDISLNFRSGEHVALVGPVGSGKTVLLQILAGLWEPSRLHYDQFTYDDIAYQHLDRKSLWHQLSFVPQTPQIFSRSLAINLSPHSPLEAASLRLALEQADLWQDVCLLPEGLSTLIGEKGLNLSGGQKQRTLIARSFHSGARLYLWDDAISALDTVTEEKVISALRQLDPDAILILATHRLSSLKSFDRILVLEEGRITRQGGLDEIKQDHALFASLLRDERASLNEEEPWT
jgi:ATP-binding cassette, subfamily B, multidrug efflux pump